MKAVEILGIADPVLVRTNKRLLDALLQSGAPLMMACGGKGLCATCHVYVERGAASLSPQTPRERVSLRMVNDQRSNSRLACQAKIFGDDVEVSLPRGRYIPSDAEVDSLIGRRASESFRHPITGAVLIKPGEIITRSRIRRRSSARALGEEDSAISSPRRT